MCNYVRFYAYVEWMIIVNVIVYDLEVDSALIKMFIPSTTSLRIVGFKLWHLMIILIDHLLVRRVELN